VVGITHPKYGEVVGAFLLPSAIAFENPSTKRPTDANLQEFVRKVLGRHKAPVHIFWFGDEEVGLDEIPQTGVGR
jgi:acyl-CoA synthetase (AMP-forming)/AMP-acid ligase II